VFSFSILVFPYGYFIFLHGVHFGADCHLPSFHAFTFEGGVSNISNSHSVTLVRITLIVSSYPSFSLETIAYSWGRGGVLHRRPPFIRTRATVCSERELTRQRKSACVSLQTYHTHKGAERGATEHIAGSTCCAPIAQHLVTVSAIFKISNAVYLS
jgi:hypothetical protein